MSPGTIAFHRPARVRPAPVESGSVTIPAPPSRPEPLTGGAWQIFAPVVGSVGMAGFALVLGESRYLVMAGVLAGVLLVSGIVGRIARMRADRRRNRASCDRYLAHLTGLRARLDRAAAYQRAHTEARLPSSIDLLAIVWRGRRVWERRPDHDDFLSVRLGTGAVDAALRPHLELGGLEQAEPDLSEAADRLVTATSRLGSMPVGIDLASCGSVAVVGDLDAGRSLARSLIAQLATSCAPIDLRMVGTFAAEATSEWGWMKWLPHCRSGNGVVASLATDPEDFDVLLRQIVDPRTEAVSRAESGELISFQRVVIVVDDYHPGSAGRLEVAMEHARRLGLLVVCIAGDPDAVPSAADATVSLAPHGTASYAEHDPAGVRLTGVDPESLDAAEAEDIARALAPLRIKTAASPEKTDSVGLLDLLATTPERLGPQKSWSCSEASLALRSPIGVGDDGEALVLDLKESASGGMGPHGMLIGATGSGKSELLRTIVLGLAATNDPDELAFVLADFKGGATFARLEGLPHVAGTISNLEHDPTLIDRMQEAVFGELEHRQRLLREAGPFDRADEYRAHRRRHPDAGLEPLPSLVLVVDEFGELLAARPDFVDLFASVGRTGRSLGVHLLLASQRIDEGRIRRLDGHLRYRMCLRTFSPEDSLAVLGTRSAADLPSAPGLGYFAVDGSLTRFRAGMVNRPLRPTEGALTEEHAIVRRFELTGISGSSATSRPASTNEMSALLERLAADDRRVRPVWLEPLPARLELLEIVEDHGRLRFPIGRSDEPRTRSQDVCVLDFSGPAGHLAVVGGPRSGKSTFLATLIASGALTHDPGDLHVYAIDLGGGLLFALEDLPHMGAVFGRSHRQEIPRLIHQLANLVERRSQEFRRHGISGMPGYLAARREGRVDSAWGEVFLVIDNWSLLVQDLPLDIVDEIGELVASGLHYGVHLVVSASRWQDLRLSMRDNIAGRFELKMTDPIESEIDRHASATVPAIAGRGLSSSGAQVQVAIGHADEVVEEVKRRWPDGGAAPAVRLLPSVVTAGDVPSPGAGVALGIEEDDLDPWSIDLFGPDPHFLVLGDGPCGKTNLLRVWLRGVTERYTPDEVQIALVDYRRQLVAEVPPSHRFGVAASSDAATSLAGRVASEAGSRMVEGDDLPTKAGPALVVVVDDFDLVVGTQGNPLSTLTDHLARGRDLGLHVVIARRVGGIARSSFEPMFSRIRELGTPGLIMNGDPMEGPLIAGVKAIAQPVGRGTVVTRHRAVLVQTVLAEEGATVHRLRREAR